MPTETLKPIKVGIGLLIAVLWIVMIVGDFWVAYRFEPVWFQRLASIWACLLLLTFGFTRMMLWEVTEAAYERGPFVKNFYKQIDPITFSEDKGWLNYISKEGQQYERPLFKREEIQAMLDDLNSFITRKVQPAEILMGLKLTLQGGYGDLLLCSLKGHGVVSCFS
jgi:hypothetical protein